MKKASSTFILIKAAIIVLVVVLPDSSLLSMIAQDSTSESVKRSNKTDRALVTMQSFFNSLSGKRFSIDTRWINKDGIASENIFETTEAEIHSFKVARFYAEKPISKKRRSLREWLFQSDGQWLQAKQTILTDNRTTFVSVSGVRDWSKVRPANFQLLLLMGHVWAKDKYVNLNDPSLAEKHKVELNENELTIGTVQDGLIKVRLSDKLDSLSGLEYSTPSNVLSRKGEFDQFVLEFHLDGNGRLEHYEKRVAGSKEIEGVRRSLRTFEEIKSPKALVEFANLLPKENHLVGILYEGKQVKEFYRHGHFFPF